MTKLSVNINKIAVVRNSRGGNLPDVVRAALDIERFGAEGITVHPRPDARHIRYDDVRDLKRALTTELNIEGNPIPGFIDLVLEVNPHHNLLVKLKEMKTAKPLLAQCVTEQLYDDCLVSAGLLDDPRTMIPRLNSILMAALGGEFTLPQEVVSIKSESKEAPKAASASASTEKKEEVK